jgi:hypothetical protein
VLSNFIANFVPVAKSICQHKYLSGDLFATAKSKKDNGEFWIYT